jgi:TetR/AcrR family transcriptional regulator, transcriptional repressor for nem operon
MPRVSRQQTDANRAAITEAATRLIRERGVDRLSVADLMAAAGLTHGGFYGHFESKQQLAATACRHAFEQSVQRWNRRVASAADAASARATIIEGFLSRASRNSPGTSCPATALAADVAREAIEAPIRTSYVQGVEALLEILASLEPDKDAVSARRAAVADFSLLLGALLLARATAGHALSDECLAAAHEQLLAPKPRLRARASARRAGS